MIHGVINIYKETGYTSHDVVAKLRGVLRQKRIGHTGTLDPAAEGVLPVCLGNATKLAERLTDKTKEYVCVMRLGLATDTDDTTGTVTARHTGALPSEAAIREACHAFLGAYEQIPPMYAAVKQGGRRLYEIARAGETVERRARHVEIAELEVMEIAAAPEQGIDVRFRTVVSKGTYIRALCRDIGERLGCGATMAALTRTRSGEFSVSSALRLTEIEALVREARGREDTEASISEALREHILPVEHFYREYPALTVIPAARKRLENGNPFAPGDVAGDAPAADGACGRVYDEAGVFRALYRYDGARKLWMPETIFPV